MRWPRPSRSASRYTRHEDESQRRGHASSGHTGQSGEPIAIIPQPVRMERSAGSFTLQASTPIGADAALAKQARQLASMLGPATGFDLAVRTGAAPKGAHIALRLERALAKTLGDEGYRLNVTPNAIAIRAAAPAGIFYGLQSLRQLLPVEIFREAPVRGVVWRVPAV